jgi:hypothetical protein
MNPRYIQTFSRHRVLLCTPIAVAVLISAWFVLGAPKSYQSTASLWLDNPPPSQTSVANTNPAILPPANQEQSVLTELLATRQFRLAVGHAGPLAAYLAHHGTAGWGPSALLAQLRGTGSLDDRVDSALGHGVSSTVAGPQVLQISVQGPTPAVAAGTLSALLNEFNQDRSDTRRTRAAATLAYYNGQLQAAQKAFDGAVQALTSYRAAHPGREGRLAAPEPGPQRARPGLHRRRLAALERRGLPRPRRSERPDGAGRRQEEGDHGDRRRPVRRRHHQPAGHRRADGSRG